MLFPDFIRNRFSLVRFSFLFFTVSLSLQAQQIDRASTDNSGSGVTKSQNVNIYGSVGQPIVGNSKASIIFTNAGFLYSKAPTQPPVPAKIFTSTNSIDFGTLTIGNYSTRSFSVRNIGESILDIASLKISGPQASDFSIISYSGQQTISPNDSIIIQLKFLPLNAGVRSSVLTLTSNDPNNPTTNIALGGNAVSTAPKLQVSQTALDFGSVLLGSKSTRTLVVQNIGNAILNITGQTISGLNASEFIFIRMSSSSIGIGNSDTIEIRFDPLSVGSKTADLLIASNDPNMPTQTIQLSGTATTVAQPKLSLSVNQIDFGSVFIGQSVIRKVIVSNIGLSYLTINSQSIRGLDSLQFNITRQSSVNIGVGQSDSIVLKFIPTSLGLKTASLVIQSNDPSTPTATIILNGSAISGIGPRISVNKTVLDFGKVSIGNVREDSVQIKNIGTSDLNIIQQSITGPDAIQFSIVQSAMTPITSGNSSQVIVRFTPNGTGVKYAFLRILSNDQGSPQTDITFLGTPTHVEVTRGISSPFYLEQNYPNPFHERTVISYRLSAMNHVRLELFDILGRKITTLVDEAQEAGMHKVEVKVKSGGIYFYKLITPEFVEMRKMIVIR